MFDSNVLASDLINDLKNEVDIATELSDSTYITFLNELEQMLYADIIHEQAEKILTENNKEITLSEIDTDDDESNIAFENVLNVFINNNHQLIRANASNGQIFDDVYYKSDKKLIIHTNKPISKVRIVYYAKPKQKTTENFSALNIALPLQFIELVKAKLRYEVYMLVNEFTPAQNWINIYNTLLANFQQWISARDAQFGQ